MPTRSRQRLDPQRIREWLAVVRAALLTIGLAYAVGRGIVTGELSLPGIVDAIKDTATAFGATDFGLGGV
jgi:hypothetical protein